METDEKVQFVCFKTTLNKELFTSRWEHFGRSLNSNMDVILQQSEENGEFSYIAQHRFTSDELEFKFSNEARNARVVQVPIKTSVAGGYSILHAAHLQHSAKNESKIFVFLTDKWPDLEAYKTLSPDGLNIYQAYYENCLYSYILEYYVKTKNVAEMSAKLKERDIVAMGVYKEYAHIKNPEKEKPPASYVWPA